MIRVEDDLFGGYVVTLSDGEFVSSSFNVTDPLTELPGLLAYHRERTAPYRYMRLPGERAPDLNPAPIVYKSGSANRSGQEEARAKADPMLFTGEGRAAGRTAACEDRPAARPPSVTRGAKWQ